MKKLTALALLATAFAAPAMADCNYPSAPAKTPDGNTATYEEMIAARTALQSYNKEMEGYLSCIKTEADDKLAKGGSDMTEDQKKQVATLYAKKNDAAVDELQTVAAKLNEQIRVYLAKHPKK